MEIIFIDRNFQSSYGCQPCFFPDEIADVFIKKGVARLIHDKSIKGLSYHESVLSPEINCNIVIEQDFYTQIAWIGEINPDIEAIGHRLGINIEIFNNRNCNIIELFKSYLIVVCNDPFIYDNSSFSISIKQYLFQRKVDFIYFIKNNNYFNNILEKQLLLNSKKVIFEKEQLTQYYFNDNQLISDSCVIKNYYQFWKAACDCIN